MNKRAKSQITPDPKPLPQHNPFSTTLLRQQHQNRTFCSFQSYNVQNHPYSPENCFSRRHYNSLLLTHAENDLIQTFQ